MTGETTKDCRLGCRGCGIQDCSMRGYLIEVKSKI